MQAKTADENDVDLRVRRRLRELRVQRGLTLEDVARDARIDVSTLSRLESGKRRLALDHLPRLAEALSVSADELLRAPEAPDPRVRGSSHTHNDITYWPLTRQAAAGGLHADGRRRDGGQDSRNLADGRRGTGRDARVHPGQPSARLPGL